jgi:hypothetical protein
MFCGFAGAFPIQAQDISVEKGLLGQLLNDEQNTIEAIALYPEDERISILEASAHPEILVRMQKIREKTEAEFKNLLSPLPEKDQQKLFSLSPYPELVASLSVGKTREEMEALLADYPEDIRNAAFFADRHYFDLLVSMNKLYLSAYEALQDILHSYAEETQKAYNNLAGLPEVITLLTENMSMTVLLGDLYKNHPTQLIYELDSLNAIVAEQRAKELNEWRQKLEDDPEAMHEYQQASQEFAREQGYDDEAYTGPIPERQVTDIYVHHIWRPYPYWFGQPWWYTYDCWYPYPWWIHSGYYYGPNRIVVIIALPSDLFMYWHFRHHRHFYHYPHFTNHAVRHYYGHRNSFTSVVTSVRKWESELQPEVPKNWLDNDDKRVERIREYGKFKMDYQSEVSKTNGIAPDQHEYLRQNADKYPTLKPVLKEKETQVYNPPPRPPKQPAQQERPRKDIIEKKKPESRKTDRVRETEPPSRERVNPPRKRETAPAPKAAPTEKTQRKPTEQKTSPRKKQ